jgi:FixJ family two-component response regulator
MKKLQRRDASTVVPSLPDGSKLDSLRDWDTTSPRGVLVGGLSEKRAALPASTVYLVASTEDMRCRLQVRLEAAGLRVLAFSSSDSFLAAWSAERHGCLLLDVDYPGFDGVDFQERLHAAGISLPIILMSEAAELPRCVRNLKPGTVDRLLVPIDEFELLARVARACEKDLVRARSDDTLSRLILKYECLTVREKQVLELVSEGLMNKQIASILDLSLITIKVHRGTMMRKMHWRRLVEVVRGADAIRYRSPPLTIAHSVPMQVPC